MRKTGLAAIAIVLLPLFFSCSEKSEQAAATETADQMEDTNPIAIENAAIEGRNAAKEIVRKDWSDTVEMQKAVLEVRARNSRYEIEGKPRCKAAFDSAFFSTIRTVRPELAKTLDPKAK